MQFSEMTSKDIPIHDDNIKVYVGTQVEQMLAVKVLDYSIRKHTQSNVSVIPLFSAVEAADIQIPNPKDPQLRPRTPFSFQRFAIPQLNSYQGRAIYVDSDMQVFRDIRELWTWDFSGADVLSVYEPPGSGRSPQFSVMVLNCQSLHWDVVDLVHQLDQGKWTYKQFVLELAPANRIAAVLPRGWNDLERFDSESTALVHYTDMDTQPWLTANNPLAHLWCRDLLEAVDMGFISKSFIAEEIQKGNIRPSLLYQIEHKIVDPNKLPPEVIGADRINFVPPHIVGKFSVKKKAPQVSTVSTPSTTSASDLLQKIYARVRILLNRYP